MFLAYVVAEACLLESSGDEVVQSYEAVVSALLLDAVDGLDELGLCGDIGEDDTSEGEDICVVLL